MTNQALTSALSHFAQHDGELLIAGRTISELAQEFPTPLYIYDRSVLQWRHRLLRENLPREVSIYYAVKANPHEGLLREIAALYDGVDLASQGEMRRALKAGIPPAKMSFAGPGKRLEELHFAVDNDIGSISVESVQEIEHLRAIGEELRKEVRILIRVNPDFELAKSGMKMGGGPKQFGIDSEEVPALLQRWRRDQYVKFAGIHIFAGSQNLHAGALVEAFQKIVDYAAQLDLAVPIVNLGGGFGIPYFANDHDLDLARVGKGLAEVITGARRRLRETQFKIELGRYIVGECGLYVCQVRYRKISRGEIFLVIDGGMHHHLAASGNLGQSLVRRPMALTVANRLHNPLEKVNVVGPLCTPLDTFGMGLELPRAAVGDLIAVMNSGAYGYSASPLGFLSHEPPKEFCL